MMPILIMDGLQVAFLIIALIFAVLAVKRVHHKKHKKQIMLIKQKVFVILIIAMGLLTIGDIIQHTLAVLGKLGYPSIADAFFAPSYVLFAVAFGYFWYRVGKIHKLHPKEPVFMFAVACGVFIWLYYLFTLSIIPALPADCSVRRFLMIFYPIIVSLMFILTLKIHPTFRAGLIRTPLWYISHGVFTHFLGYQMYAYYLWNSTYSWFPALYTALYMISALYFAIGFWAAKKKYK